MINMKKLLIIIFIGIPVVMVCFFVGVYYMDKWTDFFTEQTINNEIKIKNDIFMYKVCGKPTSLIGGKKCIDTNHYEIFDRKVGEDVVRTVDGDDYIELYDYIIIDLEL